MLRSRLAVRLIATVASLVTVAGIVAAVSSSTGAAVAAPPVNPSDGQISAAQSEKAKLADSVGRLSAQVAQMQSRLNLLKAQQEYAEQKLAYALQKLADAKDAATAAKAKVQAAQQAVDEAQREFDQYLQATYISGNVNGTTGALLTASDPNVLLQQSTLQTYQASHQLDAIGAMQKATVAKSNAESESRRAVQVQTDATTAAAKAKDDAIAAVAAAKAQEAALQGTLSQTQSSLQTAQLRLATLNNQRKQFLAYQAEQARIAEAARQARLRQEAAARAAALRQQQQQASNGGGGVYYPPAPAPTGGSWTAAKGQTAVNRAMRWLGMPYIWAGGNASGPTTGGCTDPIAACGVVGFDCSGLVLNGWAPYIALAHFADTQYWQAGSYHPSPGQFLPGDLLFWGSPGAVGGLHHVAMYIGNGNVIQAPQSGDIVRITPWDQVSYDYFGATRPLT
ncbi:MAG: peptidoglycan DL-endopeptidase RipA [Pseudonocardiales bacterium]|nr:peptidoglycan DL-endopeptidase RipA [Pseudonocardiales bacterium]